MLATTALLCAGSLAVGAAIASLCGWGVTPRRPNGGGWSWLSGVTGLAAMLVVAGVTARLPGHADTAAAALVAVTVAALAYLGLSGVGWRGPAAGLIPAALAAVGAALPFIVNNHVGVLGAGLVNDDMSSHLLVADWIQNQTEPIPKLVSGGYPLGPHSVVAALSELLSADPVNVFAGLTLSIAALGAITAMEVLRDLTPIRRIVATTLAALPYLGAAYLAQGAFKEPLQALFVVGFALGLRELTRHAEEHERPSQLAVRALPLAVIAAGSVFNYSFPGLAWLAGTAVGVWLFSGMPTA